MEGPQLVSVESENEALLLQNELQQQIAEQKASLQMVQEANDAAPSDELKEMCAELKISIQSMENSLAQLLTTADVKHTNREEAPDCEPPPSIRNPVSPERKNRSDPVAANGMTDAELQRQSGATRGGEANWHSAEPEQAGFSGRAEEAPASDLFPFKVKDRCRFRGRDGRWHNGVLVELGDARSGSLLKDGKGRAVVAYLTPTTPQMRLCSFYAQQRCRFGADCRGFHGMLVRTRGLHPYQAFDFSKLRLGERVLALREDTGLWETAEIEEKEEDDCRLQLRVAFIRDGTRARVGPGGVEGLAVPTPENAMSSSDSEPDVSQSAGDADLSGEEEESPRGGLGARVTSSWGGSQTGFDGVTSAGLGARAASSGSEYRADPETMTSPGVDYLADAEAMTSAGIQTEARLLAGWEAHTRGVASKMMAGMGFVAGSGLGRDNQGMVNPLPVEVLPKNVSLDFVRREQKVGESKKKSRGGEKSRKRKAAQAARDARAEEGSDDDDMFGFINKQLAGPGGSPAAESGRKVEPARKTKTKVAEPSERQKLLAQGEGVDELRKRIGKLQEMADRNKRDRSVSAAVQRKLDDTRKALATAEAAHESAHREIHEKERNKKLLKW